MLPGRLSVHGRRLVFWAVLAVVTVLLLSPGDSVPDGPPNSDKVVHALLFAGLALAGVVARFSLLLLGIGLVAYAVVTEVLQVLLPINRHGDLADVAVDVLGLVVGLALTLGPRGPDVRASERSDQ